MPRRASGALAPSKNGQTRSRSESPGRARPGGRFPGLGAAADCCEHLTLETCFDDFNGEGILARDFGGGAEPAAAAPRADDLEAKLAALKAEKLEGQRLDELEAKVAALKRQSAGLPGFGLLPPEAAAIPDAGQTRLPLSAGTGSECARTQESSVYGVAACSLSSL